MITASKVIEIFCIADDLCIEYENNLMLFGTKVAPILD